MNLLFVMLQTDLPVPTVVKESYFSILLKGGWILLPIFLLLFIAIFVIIERWIVIQSAENKDNSWFSRVTELIKDKKPAKAAMYCAGKKNASAKVISAGLENVENDMIDIQEVMQLEARQEVARMEKGLNYLGITAAIAPMMGFLGTIFGVINIFYNISVTNDLSIASISDGLYQKMICSGVGLFVGIIAYSGYYLLNGKIDNVVSRMEKDSGEALKYIRQLKKGFGNEN